MPHIRADEGVSYVGSDYAALDTLFSAEEIAALRQMARDLKAGDAPPD
jgi:hypothetical protein